MHFVTDSTSPSKNQISFQKVHVIVMDFIDPDSKEWQEYRSENPECSVQSFSELIQYEQVKYLLDYFNPLTVQ
jgi:hypothetical protein